MADKVQSEMTLRNVMIGLVVGAIVIIMVISLTHGNNVCGSKDQQSIDNFVSDIDLRFGSSEKEETLDEVGLAMLADDDLDLDAIPTITADEFDYLKRDIMRIQYMAINQYGRTRMAANEAAPLICEYLYNFLKTKYNPEAFGTFYLALQNNGYTPDMQSLYEYPQISSRPIDQMVWAALNYNVSKNVDMTLESPTNRLVELSSFDIVNDFVNDFEILKI